VITLPPALARGKLVVMAARFAFDLRAMQRAGKTAETKPEEGFSFLELMAVIAIMGIVSAMSFVAFVNVLPTIRADSAMQFLEAQIRQAR